MNEMENILTQLFQDKPIAGEALQSIRQGVMSQILASPVDFRQKVLVAQRRKWGIFFLGILSALSLGYFLLISLAGSWLDKVFAYANAWIAKILPAGGFLASQWEWLNGKWETLGNMRIGLELLWQQYSYSIIGILFAWVLFEGLRDKIVLKEQK
jgi:hypothetical protein